MSCISSIAKKWVAGLATYEPGRPIEEVARELGLNPNEIIKLASNENALGPSPTAIDGPALRSLSLSKGDLADPSA